MRYVSTRGNTPPTSATEALLHGLAPDGGLFFPERIPALDPATLAGLRNSSVPKVAAAMMRP
ncbi:MAG: threonine synthase, partial [Gemmatimonadetes bacterium]|nr:threonine synthase [Gemmatimonadota bacterium]